MIVRKNKQETKSQRAFEIYLHCPPVIWQKRHCISKISVMLCSQAITIILSFVTPSYVETSYVFEVSKHRNLFNTLKPMSVSRFSVGSKTTCTLFASQTYLTTKLISHKEVQHHNLQEEKK